MQINRSNYEIWFIDWLDGNLDSNQVEQLKLFLNGNPDLNDEFNDFTSVTLVSSGISFPNKEYLKKSPVDISLTQFEYLCAAYLENDLSASQQTELKEIIDTYPDKKKTFDLIQKTRLVPPRIIYKRKSLLHKRTSVQKIVRLSVIGLSAAAAIALIIIINSVLPVNNHLEINGSAKNIEYDSTLQNSSPVFVPKKIMTDNMSVPAKQEREKRLSNIQKEEPVIANSDMILSLPDDSLIRKFDNQEITVNKIPVFTQVDLKKGIVSNTLIVSNSTINSPIIADERSETGRFISKTFREIFLKEKTPTDSPLKGFEIAEAGVTGLNRIFGWQMALDKKNDENGQLKSVYFSSKILKFNAPVKKSEQLQ